jgi:hypothetical protein
MADSNLYECQPPLFTSYLFPLRTTTFLDKPCFPLTRHHASMAFVANQLSQQTSSPANGRHLSSPTHLSLWWSIAKWKGIGFWYRHAKVRILLLQFSALSSFGIDTCFTKEHGFVVLRAKQTGSRLKSG